MGTTNLGLGKEPTGECVVEVVSVEVREVSAARVNVTGIETEMIVSSASSSSPLIRNPLVSGDIGDLTVLVRKAKE